MNGTRDGDQFQNGEIESRARFLIEFGWDLPVDSARTLAESMHVRRLKPDEFLFHKGEKGDMLYQVVRGRLQALTVGDQGQELVFRSMPRGQIIGEMTVLDASPRTASVRAEADAAVLGVHQGTLVALARRDPEILLAIALFCARRARAVSWWAEHTTLSPAEVRLADLLVELNRDTGGDGRISITQQGLADRLGLRRESVNRLLGQWQREGLVRLGRGWIEIDGDGLKPPAP